LLEVNALVQTVEKKEPTTMNTIRCFAKENRIYERFIGSLMWKCFLKPLFVALVLLRHGEGLSNAELDNR
jgi:hypothetical protein